MLRVRVCAAQMGGFLGPKFSKQGSLFPRGISLQKISYAFGKNPFVCKKNPSKIRKNPFVLKKSRTLLRMSEMPLAFFGRFSLNMVGFSRNRQKIPLHRQCHEINVILSLTLPQISANGEYVHTDFQSHVTEIGNSVLKL